MAVGLLAVEAARVAAVDQETRNHIVAAALLHDIGHLPLSHSSESFFKQAYGLGHRQLACDIVLGRERQFADTREVLLDHRVDPVAVCSAIKGEGEDLTNYLLNSPLNVDAIDGAIRSANFFVIPTNCLSAKELVSVSLAPSPMGAELADHFWETKAQVYKRIYGAQATQIDNWFKNQLGRRATKREEWSLSDEELLDSMNLLEPTAGARFTPSSRDKTHRTRRLGIKPSVKLRRKKDFYGRYYDSNRRIA